jgi:hypothetical protein
MLPPVTLDVPFSATTFAFELIPYPENIESTFPFSASVLSALVYIIFRHHFGSLATYPLCFALLKHVGSDSWP